MSRCIRIGDAVRISWRESGLWGFEEMYDGKVGVVIDAKGRISDQHGDDLLYLVDIEGNERNAVLASRHLEVLRPDLDEYVHSTRFALTGADVAADHLGKQRY